MKIPSSPKHHDPIRYRRLYPVDRIHKVEIDHDDTLIIEFDCLDREPQDSIPGFERQPTQAVIGMTRENARKLLALIQENLANHASPTGVE